jgi:hypothetical protein
LEQQPADAQARFGLGALRFLRAVERVSQAMYRHGVGADAGNAGLVRSLPVFQAGGFAPNPKPEPIDAKQFRQMFLDLVADLAAAERTLAEVNDPAVKLPLHIGRVRLDFNGDGVGDEDEQFWTVFVRLNGGARNVPREQVEAFRITFDAADVHWLRGYCHLLSAMLETFLAHDADELFHCGGHLLFPKAVSPYPFLAANPNPADLIGFGADTRDLLAFVHQALRLPLKEPKRMTAALGHLEAMARESREMWKLALAETDDAEEWIPNPKQTGVIPGVRVTAEMVQGWHLFLDETDAVLAGKKLLPFWRSTGKQGVNLRRVFTEPRPVDLLLWVQGTAAAPYLEDGPTISTETWDRLQRMFGGEFLGFALWFN